MAFPSFADVEKCCKDLFKRGYHFGLMQVSAKAKAGASGMDINTNNIYTAEDSTLSADIQAKKNLASYGLTVASKWNTKNLITSEFASQDYIAKGLKVGGECRLNFDTGIKSGLILGQFKIENATVDLSVEAGDETNLLVNTSAIAGYQGYFGGYDLSYDTVEAVLKRNSFIVGLTSKDCTGSIKWDNMEKFTGSYYQKISERVETGIQGSTKTDDSGPPIFAITGKYVVNPCGVIVRAKVDTTSQLGLGCELNVARGTTLLFSGNIDLVDFSAGAHKFGFAVEFS